MLRGFRPRIGAAVGAALLLGVLSVLGACTLYLLNLALAVVAGFVGTVVVFERRGPVAAIQRSYRLAVAHLGVTAGVVFAVMTLDGFLSFGLAGLIEAGYLLVGSDDGSQKYVAGQVSGAIASFLLAPTRALSMSLLYLTLRARTDGWDLVRDADRRGVALAPDPYSESVP